MIPANPPHSATANLAAQFLEISFSTSASLSTPQTPYYTRLYPWCIIRLLPQMQRLVVARSRKRNEAEEHLKALKRMNPEATYIIVFDPPDRPTTLNEDSTSV